MERLTRAQSVRPDLAGLAFDLLFDAGDPNLEKLIQVRTENRKKFDAFDQRLGRILGFFENAAIELEPAQLAINKIPRIGEAICCRNIFPQGFDLGGGLVGDTDLGNSCRHLPSLLNR
jgi:hypothetical protein